MAWPCHFGLHPAFTICISITLVSHLDLWIAMLEIVSAIGELGSQKSINNNIPAQSHPEKQRITCHPLLFTTLFMHLFSLLCRPTPVTTRCQHMSFCCKPPVIMPSLALIQDIQCPVPVCQPVASASTAPAPAYPCQPQVPKSKYMQGQYYLSRPSLFFFFLSCSFFSLPGNLPSLLPCPSFQSGSAMRVSSGWELAYALPWYSPCM
ncbi:hypothetical protein J3F84DRAFT_127127 [Trichoderma pleuroticola]